MVTTDKVLLNDWHPVASSQECQENALKRVRLLGEDLVLWRSQDAKSAIQAWQDHCPHRGARISLGKVADNTVICGYHGWQFEPAGKCVHIPADPKQKPPTNARVKTYQCQERYGLVWVCLGEPSQDLPSFPEWHELSYRKLFFGPYKCRSSGFRVIENAFDVSHFSFAHGGSLGSPENAEIEDYQVDVDIEGITIGTINLWQTDFDGSGTSGKVKWSQKICRPLMLYQVKESPQGRYTLIFAVTPIEENESLVWGVAAMNYDHQGLESDLQAFQDELWLEDAKILESQRPVCLPLLSQNKTDTNWLPEVHANCDRASIAYRRWLKDLGITFGVC